MPRVSVKERLQFAFDAAFGQGGQQSRIALPTHR